MLVCIASNNTAMGTEVGVRVCAAYSDREIGSLTLFAVNENELVREAHPLEHTNVMVSYTLHTVRTCTNDESRVHARELLPHSGIVLGGRPVVGGVSIPGL